MLRLAPNGYYRFFQEDQLQATFGGAEANVAVSLANFGEKVSFVTKLPEHAIGQAAVNSLRWFGVDTGSILRGGNRVGIYYLEKGANQRSSVCIYDRTHSSVAESRREEYDWDSVLEGADWFHFTGITPALNRELAQICLDACSVARKRGISVSCDLNYRAKLWEKEEAGRVMGELCRYVDVCIANEEDAKNVFGMVPEGSDIEAGVLNRSGYESIARQLRDRFGFRYVAFTLRSSLSATVNNWAGMLYDGQQFYYSRDYHLDHIVDRVGGGDSFGAGLIYGLRKGYDGRKTIEFAVAASALKHSIEGDFNRISVDEVEKLTGGDGSGRVQR